METQIFIIDFDSTFVQVEALVELATISLKNKPHKREILDEIESITSQGIEEKISFSESLKKRIELLNANKMHLEQLVRRLKRKISVSIMRNKEFIKKYAEHIYIISGGFREFIEPIVEQFDIPAKNIFGTRTVWRGAAKVQISDIHRTIIDMLNNPAQGGGIQHINDCFITYLKRLDHSDELLLEYADRLGNGAVFKRLGFLAERQTTTETMLIDACRAKLTEGNAKLDPDLECPRLISRWRLWIPQSWIEAGRDD